MLTALAEVKKHSQAMRQTILKIEAQLDGLKVHRKIEMAAWHKKLAEHEAFFPPVEPAPFHDAAQQDWDRWYRSLRSHQEFNWHPQKLKHRERIS